MKDINGDSDREARLGKVSPYPWGTMRLRTRLRLGIPCVLAFLLIIAAWAEGQEGYWELQGEPKLEAYNTSAWADQNEWEGKIISFDKTHVSYAFRHPTATKGVWKGGKMEWDPLPGILILGERIPARLKIEEQGDGLSLVGGGALPMYLLLGRVGEMRNDPEEKAVSKGSEPGAVDKIVLDADPARPVPELSRSG